jgi:GNAT superfamily N-acetyltransferase
LSSPTQIRPLREEDVRAVARLATQLGYPANASDLAERLKLLQGSPSHGLFTAVDAAGGEVLGWIHVAASHALIHDPLAEIVSLVVDETRRGAGVGAALVRAAEAWSRSRGLGRLRVRCRVERERAHRFYEREGLVPEKTQNVLSKPV